MTPEQPVVPQIIDTTFYSDGFPKENWDKLLSRNNYLAQIESLFNDGANVIFLKGEEDAGKTTICAQYARRHLNKTITVFFNNLNNLDYKLEYYFSNVVGQISHILRENENPIESQTPITAERYTQYTFSLRRALKKGGDKITLILDGLEDRVKEDPDFVRRLFAVVPFGEQIFRIIISGDKDSFLEVYPKLKKHDNIESIPLAGFSDPEIKEYLGLSVLESNAETLYNVTRGYPGRLKTLKRLFEKENYSLDQITRTTNYKNWLELDSASVNLDVPLYNVILSLLALKDNAYTVATIAEICQKTQQEVQAAIDDLGVLEITGKNVNFVSLGHKRHFSNRLRGNKKAIEDLLISYYSGTDSINALIELPKIFAERNNWTEIIEIVDNDYLEKILENTGSIKVVNDGLAVGLQAAEQLQRYSGMLGYSIQGSIVNEIDNYLFWESEIDARIAINDFVGAISLAQCALLKVDRLNLLALIARRQKERNKIVDEDLAKLIQELYQTTDISLVGSKIYDIVANLLYAIPNLAVEMIEKSGGEISEKDINNWVVAKLAVAAIDSSIKDKENPQTSKQVEAIQKLNNPAVRKINRAISFLVGNYSSTKVLEEVQKLVDPKERLRLLRLWISNNESNTNDIDKVINKALDELLLSSSQISISLDILKELSYPLPYIRDSKIQLELLYRFKAIEKDFSNLGLTKDKYIYQLTIFHTQFVLDPQTSMQSINGILNEIDKIDDALIKIDSFAEVFAKLCELDRNSDIHRKIGFVYSRILSLSKELFDSTANQYNICKYLLKTVSKQNPKLGLKICEQMNTASRREASRLLILETYLTNKVNKIFIEVVGEIEASLEFTSSREDLYLSLLERYADEKNLNKKQIIDLLPYFDKVKTIPNISDRLKGLIFSYKIASKEHSMKSRLKLAMESIIEHTLGKIESEWEKIDNGFTVCSELARISETFARKVFNETEEIKKSSWIDSHSVAYAFVNSIKLVIRSYTTLLVNREEEKGDYSILKDLIDRIPSELERLNLWTELSLFAYGAGREDIAKKILDSHVLPIMQSLNANRIKPYENLSVYLLIHLYNPELSLEFISQLSSEDREEAYGLIADYYITRHNPYEVYDRSFSKYNTSYNDLDKAIKILRFLEVDSNIYYEVVHLCNAILDNKSSLHNAQISSLAAAMEEVIGKKLPDTRNIKHLGYKLLASAKVARIKRDTNHKTYWTKLLDDVNQIPNKSDLVFVKAILLDEIPFEKIPGGKDLKANLFEEVITLLDTFKSHYEYAQRVVDSSEIMYKIDKSRWKEVVNKAFTITAELEEGAQAYSTRRNIIDTMFRLDPSYAKDLMKLVDKGDTRSRLNDFIKDYYSTLEMSDKIKQNKPLDDKEKENHLLMVQAVFKSLASLNIDKSTPKKVMEICSYLNLGNKLPLHQVFPVFLYFLSNCSRTYRASKLDGTVADLHRENFRATVNATNIVQLLSYRKKTNEQATRQFFIDAAFSSNRAIHPDSREEALTSIREWLDDEAEEFVIIADPYFQKEDLDILKVIKEVRSDIEINILGSKNGWSSNVENEFKDYWRRISDEPPPFTNIIFCWIPDQNNQTPFHDRWILTKNGGLRPGTSLSSIGRAKESELSVLSPNDALKMKEDTLFEYISMKKKSLNTFRIAYKSFTL